MRNVTFRQLRAVSAVARSGRIANAAKELNLTGPAVTLQIKQMEEEIGLLLFDRTPQGLRPTDAGRVVLQSARDIGNALSNCADRIEALKGLEGGKVAVAVVSTAKYYAPHIVAAFSKRHPRIDVELVVGNRGEIVEALRDFEADLAIMGRPPRDIPVEACVLGDHPLVIVAAPDHRLAGRREVARAELAGETFLVREAGSGTRSSMEIFLADGPSHPDARRIEFGSNETIKQAVMAGLGIAFISAHTVAAEIEAGRLVHLDIVGLPVRRQWFVVRRKDRSPSPAAAAFRDFVLSSGTRFLPHFPILYSELGPQSR